MSYNSRADPTGSNNFQRDTMTVNRVCAALLMISLISMCAFLYLFVSRNAPGLQSLYATAAIALVYGAVFLHSSLRLARSLWIKQAKPANRNSARIAQILFGLMALLLIWVFLDATVTDYYQPVSLFDDVILALGLSWGLLVILFFVLLLRATYEPLNCLRYALFLGVVAILGWPVMASLAYLN